MSHGCPRREHEANVLQTFGGEERHYIAAMCNQRLDDVAVLLAHIDWESGVDDDTIDLTMLPSEDTVTSAEGTRPETFPDSVWDTTNECDFELAFRHYIVQRGHPDSPIIREMVGDTFEQSADDPLLRARLFLMMLTGSDLVPQDPNWSIMVSIVPGSCTPTESYSLSCRSGSYTRAFVMRRLSPRAQWARPQLRCVAIVRVLRQRPYRVHSRSTFALASVTVRSLSMRAYATSCPRVALGSISNLGSMGLC